ncbi:MAG: hypothetical protein QOF81_3565 [Acidimicrobiaceae bacterium]|nr:hypothetical protein [Acidimicrobiaceae bacterium]
MPRPTVGAKSADLFGWAAAKAHRVVYHRRTLAPMTRAELHEIIERLPDDALEGASVLLKRVAARQIDPEEAWCWTDEWQEKLRASLEDIDGGRVRSYQTAESFLQAL